MADKDAERVALLQTGELPNTIWAIFSEDLTMPTAISQINWLAVLAATVAHFFLGGIWFGLLFAKPYARPLGIEDRPPRSPRRSPLRDHPAPSSQRADDRRRDSGRARDKPAHDLSRYRGADRSAGADPGRGRGWLRPQKGFDLPPPMLTSNGIEAVTLGAQWVIAHAGSELARAALAALTKTGGHRPGRSASTIR